MVHGCGAGSDDSSSAGHPAEFSKGELAELMDVERDTYKEAGPPPPNASNRIVPKKCGIAPVGQSWQDTVWRTEHRKEYCTRAAESAGKVTKDGQPVRFIVTTTRARATNESTPNACYYIAGTMTATWDPSEFVPIQESLQGHESAPEAAADAEQAENGHAAD